MYPDNLPIVAAKGGPGGKPGCGSLPDVAKNFPVRQLITNTGWGTGVDVRPNPGIGHPCYANWLPVTRAVPEPPSIRQCLPGPAIGPVPVSRSATVRRAAVRARRGAAVAGGAAGRARPGAGEPRVERPDAAVTADERPKQEVQLWAT